MLYIILTIKQDINSFSLIMKRLPKLNSKILSERIDTLMEKGIITRDVSQSKPLRITYHLTEK